MKISSPNPGKNPLKERLAKRIARAGVCSRREAEELIRLGRVRVEGKAVLTPALDVTPSQKVEVDGQALGGAEPTRLWLYHKPAGLVTTHKDPQGRATVFEKLPKELPRVISIGRLDLMTEGLLLLTNDGALARHLELPATGWIRRYRARVHGRITPEMIGKLAGGMTVGGTRYGPVTVTVDRAQASNSWITVRLTEGKNREVRTLFEHFGCRVNRLIRVAYGPFQLGALAGGAVREVPAKALRELLGKWALDE